MNLAGDFEETPGVVADKLLKNGDVIDFADTCLSVLSTRGHSPGSVCYVDKKNKLIFSGDTLFCLTVGRTDFFDSDECEMEDSITRLYKMEGDFDIYPGHNRATTMEYEKRRNRYMRRFK